MGRGQAKTLGKVVLLVLIAVALQTLVVSHVTVLGVGADLFLIFTVMVAISWGSLAGAVFGFVAGIAADIAYLEPLGMRALVYVLTGYSLGVVAGRFGAASLWNVFLYTVASSFVAQVVFGVFAYVMGPREGFFTVLGLQMLPGAVLDALLAVPVFLLLVKLRVISMPRPEPTASGSAMQ
ncbi:MAG: rod shape-determining protein MreD [Actinobacteria bacterium RBG_13_63_9]|nr:MAG: rod shape-determining protein MreD [Actinobacteria bacterium RBG_13_63_9]